MCIDLSWWFNFVFHKLDRVTAATRSLVRTLDARSFAKDAYDFSSDQQDRSLTKSFQRALRLLPNVNSLLLDGHSDIDHAALMGSQSPPTGPNHLQILSVIDCSYQLPSTFFNAPHLQTLVYLDVSNLPGSILPLVQPTSMPALRILKVRGRELENSALHALVANFGLRLWSLDLSNNKISDDAIQEFRDWCLPTSQLRTHAHLQAEGGLVVDSGGAPDYGLFFVIQESDLSKSFSHPERYFIDAPAYVKNADLVTQEYQVSRLDGSTTVRNDNADAAKSVLSGFHDHIRVDDYQKSLGCTHIRLSHNHVSALGLQKLLRISSGHIQDLACDYMSLLPRAGGYRKAWPAHASLGGILGAAHLFRPVFSSNLRVLRIHHSLVTNIPTLEVDGLSSLARQYIAEAAIMRRADQAYPQAFIPDMNPRLLSLTLTCLPRRSSGPLISRLVHFLKLLSIQERGIQDASLIASTRHCPGVLQGLRHLRLEFEPDSLEDGFSTSEDLDPEELMNSGEKIFSFFESQQEENRQPPSRSRSYAKEELNAKGVANNSPVTAGDQASGSDRDNSDFVIYEGDWNGQTFSIQVWAGPNSSDAPEVLKDYRRLVLERHVRDGVGPATPAQILAGAPCKSFIFHVAWSAAVMPTELTTPTHSELAGMSDVLDVLKTYRLNGRANYSQRMTLAKMDGRLVQLGEPHYFWTGRLEVSTEPAMPLARPSQYWR